MKLTKERARLICEAHDIEQIMSIDEEVVLLDENNPELADAYRALLEVAGLLE